MNMYDYLKWRGDLSFKASPFNNVDALLFSYIIYTDLREVIGQDETITLQEAAQRLFQLHTEEELLSRGSFIDDAPVVMRRMSETKRFKDVRISNYVNRIDEENTEQFSAAHYQLDSRTDFIAICGTDDTMVGWKEDFQMSYRIIRSMESSVEYLNSTANRMFHHYYIGGHSKGGCLAVYAAMMAQQNVRKKILKIFSLDGPGLPPHCVNKEGYDAIKDRIIKIVPEFSFFGLLFDKADQEGKTVVKSSSMMFMQHDAISWQITGADFDKGTLSEDCIMIQQGFISFLNTMDYQQRRNFVSEVFSAFKNAGIEKVSSITKKKAQALLKMIEKMVKVNEETKKAFATLVTIYGKLVVEKAEGTVKARAKETYEFFNSLIKRENKKKDTEDDNKTEAA